MFKSNMQQFLKDAQKAIDLEVEEENKKFREVVAESYSKILEGSTAVDTGLYKNSHLIEIGNRDNAVITGKTRKIRQKKLTIQEKRSARQEDKIAKLELSKSPSVRIYNNVEYADEIESGEYKVRQNPFLYKKVREYARSRFDRVSRKNKKRVV